MHKGLLWIFAPGPRHPIRCRRRARALLSDASDVAVHLAERAIDVANPSIEVAALDLNRHATFGARQRWATPKLADSVRNGRAAVAVEVDLLVVEVKPAHQGSGSQRVDNVELRPVIHARLGLFRAGAMSPRVPWREA